MSLEAVADGVYFCAFLPTRDGVVVFDAPRASATTADIEIFTWTTSFAIMQSLRLDRRPSGPAHP